MQESGVFSVPPCSTKKHPNSLQRPWLRLISIPRSLIHVKNPNPRLPSWPLARHGGAAVRVQCDQRAGGGLHPRHHRPLEQERRHPSPLSEILQQFKLQSLHGILQSNCLVEDFQDKVMMLSGEHVHWPFHAHLGPDQEEHQPHVEPQPDKQREVELQPVHQRGDEEESERSHHK